MPQILDRELPTTSPSGCRRGVHVAVSLVVAIAATVMLGVAVESPHSHESPSQVSPRQSRDEGAAGSLLALHEPIAIVGNAGFTGSNASTGVVWGSGSEADPYVISGWEIEAASADGISVKDTDVYFEIRDCYIHGGIGNYNAGIYLENCTHAIIRNNTCVDDWDGVYLSSCTGVIVAGNNCSYDNGGVILSRSVNITLRNNTMWGNGISVTGYTLEECNSHDIDTSNTVNGLPILYYKDETDVDVPTGEAGQVILANCTGFLVEGNVFKDATAGVILLFSSDTTVRNNTCVNSVYGIIVWFSNGNRIFNNTVRNDALTDYWWGGVALVSSSFNEIVGNICSDSSTGVVLFYHSNDNTVADNVLAHNVNGIRLQSSDRNRITRNAIHDNSMEGAFVVSSAGNIFWNNTFVRNNGATDTYDPSHNQALEAGMKNAWNDSQGYGNYWSDWTSPDVLPPLGRVDLPYEIGGLTDSVDNWPLTGYPAEPIPEFGFFPTAVATMVVTMLVAAAWRRQWPKPG